MQSQILPSRSALVDRVALQFEYGQNLICLVGSSGLGKSYLAESFITDKYPEFNKAFIHLSASMKDAELMTQLLQNSFTRPLIDATQSLSQNFFQLYREQACGPCLWVLDGARHLSDEMIAELQLLAKKSPDTLYILLTAQAPSILPDALDIHIEPLSLVESKRLMAMFFKQLPMDEDPIFQTFLRSCAGNPTLLLQWQPELQVDLRAAKPTKKKASWHLILFAVLLAMLMVAFIYQKELVSFLPQSQSKQQTETVLQSEQVLTENLADEHQNSPNEQGLNEQPPQAAENVQNSSPQIETESNPNPSSQDVAAIVSALAVNSSNEASEQAITASNEVEQFKREITQAKSSTSEQPEAVEPQSTAAKTQQQPSTDEQTQTSKQQGSATAEVQTQSLPETSNEENVMVGDGPLLMTLGDDEWVVQLSAVKEFNVAREFANEYNLRDVKIYRAIRFDSEWWIVVQGPYATLEAAQAARSKLPQAVLNGQPFFKKVDKIKQEISLPTR